MKKKRIMRILSALLCTVMVVGMIPASPVTVNAEGQTDAVATGTTNTVSVDTWEELAAALSEAGDSTIILTDDVKLKVELQEVKGKDPYKKIQITVAGNKKLDLNGYSIRVVDESNAYKHASGGYYTMYVNSKLLEGADRTLIKIPANASLTVNGGDDDELSYEAYVMDDFNTSLSVSNHRYWEDTTYRNLFDVYGQLVINGGKLVAGHIRKFWVDLCQYEDGKYTGYARRYVHGSVAHVRDGGVMVVNSGMLYGHGQGPIPHCPSEDTGIVAKSYNRDSVIEYFAGSKLIINGGAFYGMGGANVFSGKGKLTVRGGYFQTDKNDKELGLLLVPGNVEAPAGVSVPHSSGTGYVHPIYKGTYGHIGIPNSAFSSEAGRMQIFVDNAIYTGNGGHLDLDQTGGQSSGESLGVTIVPYLNQQAQPKITLTGGPYKDRQVYEDLSLDWNPSSNNLVATVDYKAYYGDKTGLENAGPNYIWHVWGKYGTNGEASKDFVTTSKSFDITAAWEEVSGGKSFRAMSISCFISESPTNGDYKLETGSLKFRLDPTKTPLDVSSLPYGKMEVGISYPNFSGLGTDIVVTVEPTPKDMAKPQNGNCTVVYQYLYRDNMAQWEDKPFVWSDNQHHFTDMDWGHVKVDVTMIAYGSDGIARRFTQSAWALKLPDITASNGSWSPDKSTYIGRPNMAVSLQAPLTTTNAQVAADKIVTNDIVGWYQLTYDANGTPSYTGIGGAKMASAQVTKNGTYCYAAKDRDGNIIYSKPVQVLFSAAAYSINVTKSNTNSFVINEDGTTSNDVLLTAAGGSSIERTMLRWKVVSWPVGGDSCLVSSAIVNSKTSFTKNISNFFSTSKLDQIVPGEYVIQVFAQQDGHTLSSSNRVTVNVKRVADGIDITTDKGQVVNGKTIEGPYVGSTMQLNCAPADGASDPQYTKGITWDLETLVGTNVATIDENGLLTAKNPGQVKITVTATYPITGVKVGKHIQTVIVNIPITEIEISLGTPDIGVDPASIVSVPVNAPYEWIYNGQNSWASGLHGGTGQFYGNAIPELYIAIAPKDGYVFPARQIYMDISDETWYTYADDMVIKVNGNTYNFRDFETTYTDGSTEYGEEYGTFWEPQEITFAWVWDRLIDPSHTYLDRVDLKVSIPKAGDDGDLAPNDEYFWMLPKCTNTDAVLAYVNNNGIYKVSGNYLKDNDRENDNAVKMEDGETFQKGQMYRANIYFSTSVKNNTTYFGKQVTLMINGTPCQLVDLYDSPNVEGLQYGKAYYYFTPAAGVTTISNLILKDLPEPKAFAFPVRTEDIKNITSDVVIGDEVYVSRIKWFVDSNGNKTFDSGEDAPKHFNADGSFACGKNYSVEIAFEVQDRDSDGNGDLVRFGEKVDIYMDTETHGRYQFTGNADGAVYHFPATATAVADEGLSLKGVNVDFASSLTLNFNQKASILSQYENVFVIFEAEGKEPVKVTQYTLSTDSDGDIRWNFGYEGLTILDVNLTINATIYGTKDGVLYKDSKVRTYSLLKYTSKAILDETNDKVPCANLLKYAIAAEAYKEYQGVAVATLAKTLTAAQTAAMNKFAYADSKFAPSSTNKTTANAVGTKMKFSGQSVNMDSRITLIYKMEGLDNGLDMSKVTFKISYTDAQGKPQVKYYTIDDAIKTEAGYEMYFAQFHATQLKEQALLTVYIDGVEHCSYGNSVENYCYVVNKNSSSNSAEMIALAKRILLYGEACAATYGK